jgi:hypothetical protein
VSAAEPEAKDPFFVHSAMVVAAGMLGLVGAYLLPRSPADRLPAFIGVAAAVFSGVVALSLKRRALKRSISAALLMLGVVFGLRMVLVALGLLYVIRAQLGQLAFILGFFGVYFALQWIEISYVHAATRRRSPGGL